jgi:uncharacterized protein (TIGR03083 family)
MEPQLTVGEHLAAIERAANVLTDAAARAGLDAPVPTCPKWDVRALVTHQGMVHRWAAANLRGEKGHQTSDSEAAAAAAPDLLAWFTAGVDDLLTTIRGAPDDVEAMVFLADAPPPRRFWARRQAHETTIHSVDAVAASLGRMPSSADVIIPATLAADGIDELLRGFITRGKGKLRTDQPVTISVRTDDTAQAWTVHATTDSLVTTRERSDMPDAELRGTAAQLYLGLWNRGDEVEASGRADVLTLWRNQVQIRWR